MKLFGFHVPFTSRGGSSIIQPYAALKVPLNFEPPPILHTVRASEMAAPANPQKERKTVISEMPILGGAKYVGSVMPTNFISYYGLTGIFVDRPMTDTDFERLYEYGRTNHDVSYAKDNIVQLASGGFTITLPESIPAAKAAQIQEDLRNSLETWYKGGRTRLINDLLRQIALFGCISAEGQPSCNFRNGIGRVVLLAPKYVYFAWDEAEQDWSPYQLSVGGVGMGGYSKLNRRTYSYLAYEQWRDDIPYAVPPFASALRAACIEDDMLDNLSMITKRLGLLGFLKVVVAAPTRGTLPDGGIEPEQDWQDRVFAFLQSMESQVQNGLGNGYTIAAKQYDSEGNEISPDFEMTPSTADAAGAKSLMELINQIKSAGLKQDPAMLGKNFNTTESLITVILTKFSTQLMNYQALVAQFLEKIFSLHILLKYGEVIPVTVEMEPPMLQDTKVQYEGQIAKFTHFQNMYLQGLISQQEFANKMGLSKPYAPAPPMPPAPEGTTPSPSVAAMSV